MLNSAKAVSFANERMGVCHSSVCQMWFWIFGYVGFKNY